MEKIEHKKVLTNGINMHVAISSPRNASTRNSGTILFLHGFPELWYSWRHQLVTLSSLGYTCIAPDLRGYGDTDAPLEATSYTVLHVIGDLVGLLDGLGVKDKVFLVGHDWGAIIAWQFCLLRGDRVKALVNTSVAFVRRDARTRPVQGFRRLFGDDYYICRFQKVGEAEEDFARVDTAKLMKKFLCSRSPRPPCIPKHVGYSGLPDVTTLPSWLTEEDVNYYASKFSQKGFTGPLNYYRNLDLNWELTASLTGLQIKIPVKFIVGDLDLTYHIPGVKEYIHSGRIKKDVPFLQEVIVMEGVAHFLNQEKPEEISQHIYDFIQKF